VTEKFPRKVVYCATKITFLLQERLQQQLDEQAQRYEEQLTELHSVIAELTRKLHQQRTMAIAEEDEVSGNGALSFFAISQRSTFSSGPETKTILLGHRVSVSLLFDVTSHILVF
jgi:TolA-binding protein